jgi:PEGA domain
MLASLFDRRFVGVAVALALALHAATGQAQSSEEQYRRMVDDAVREFSAEHWEEARALFKRAHELAPNARTLRGMGMTAFELRMYVQALRELNAALAEKSKPLSPDMRAAVEQLIAKAHEFVGNLTLVSEPPNAKLLVDGKEPQTEPDGTVLLDVGTHVVSASLDGYKPTNLRISVEGGADQTVRVPMEPLLAIAAVPAMDPFAGPKTAPPPAQSEPAPAPAAPPPAPAPTKEKPSASSSNLDTIAWIALAAGGAFGVTSGVFWLIGDSKVSKLQKECGDSCTDAKIEESGVKRMDTLTNVFLVATGVAAVTSGVLFGIYAGSSEDAEPEGMALDVGPGSVRVRGTF